MLKRYSKVVLMPGDPLRAKFTDTFLEDVVHFNDVRNMFVILEPIRARKSVLWGQEWGCLVLESILMNYIQNMT